MKAERTKTLWSRSCNSVVLEAEKARRPCRPAAASSSFRRQKKKTLRSKQQKSWTSRSNKNHTNLVVPAKSMVPCGSRKNQWCLVALAKIIDLVVLQKSMVPCGSRKNHRTLWSRKTHRPVSPAITRETMWSNGGSFIDQSILRAGH